MRAAGALGDAGAEALVAALGEDGYLEVEDWAEQGGERRPVLASPKQHRDTNKRTGGGEAGAQHVYGQWVRRRCWSPRHGA